MLDRKRLSSRGLDYWCSTRVRVSPRDWGVRRDVTILSDGALVPIASERRNTSDLAPEALGGDTPPSCVIILQPLLGAF
jgi:hypothetical protein